MKKTILILLVVFVLGVAAILGYAATKPDVFRVQRTAMMDAPPSAVFPLVNDFQKWRTWSPWEKLDPEMKRTYSESTVGQSATYAWAGNSQAGEGKMTITESKPDEKVAIKLDFMKPMEATSNVEFTFKPEGSGTNVSWTMQGDNTFMGKLFSVFLDMDTLVGADFEKGLAGLNAESKKSAAQ